MAGSRHEQLRRAVSLIDTDADEAHKITITLLNEDADDPLALFVMARILAKADRLGVALHLYRRVAQLSPARHEAWNDLGMCLSGLQKFKDGRDAFLEACKRAPKDSGYIANVAMTYLEDCNYPLALKWAEKSLAVDPGQVGALQSRGFASLALGDWKTGWAGYDKALGGKFRKEVVLADEPRWDGKRVDTLFVYGEQGLGDEIMMASCVPDVARDVGKVVLECDPRLEGLFKRSFPAVDVYGTRRSRSVDWASQYKIDAGEAIGALPKYYRPTPESCPGTPYLVADPERRIQWRALFDSLGPKPKIGICWSGGKRWTNAAGRSIGLEAFKPLFDSVDADWISLQYKDPSAEIKAGMFPVKHWPHATQTQDYDDLAAMVSELDLVIGIHTAAHHLAGALGVPGIVLVPSKGLWIWNLDPMPWYRSARTFRQRTDEPWHKTIQRLSVDDSCMGRLRPARSSGVSHLLSVGSGNQQATSGAHAAESVAAG